MGQMIRVADVYQTIGIFRPRSIDQTIEFFYLPAFAFPTDEFLLGFTPGAVPMEKEETLPPIPMVDSFEALGRCPEQSFVVLAMRLIRIGVVREEAEEQIAFFVRQVPDFQLFHLRPDRLRIYQHHGHNDQRSKCVRNARNLKIHLWKGSGWKQPHDEVIQNLERELADGDQQKEGDDKPDPGSP